MEKDPLSKAVTGFLNLFRKKQVPPPTPPPPTPKKPREPEKPRLKVTSHVARDLLQNAAYFSALPKAVAEYVTNAIDAAQPGRAVHCEVTVGPDEITISDDGSGMTFAELSNFFQMHGENVQRKRGRTVRGKFGTGKSAAFGIADTLQVETVKGGRRSLVELHRVDVESAKDGHPIPVREFAVDSESPDTTDGTVIRIRDLRLADPDPAAVQSYLEKLLGQHLRSHKVYVNGKPCRYRTPKAELKFDFTPPEAVSAAIGKAKCRLCVSPDELERDANTIAVLCHGFLHAATLAGRSREPLVEYIFGEVEVPALDDDPGPVPAFDNTRSLALNPHNPRVQALEAWLGTCIDQVLAELAERERKRKSAREARLLRRVAGRIKSLLDEDFQSIQQDIPWANLPSSRKVETREAAARSDTKPTAGQILKKKPSLLKRGWMWLRRLFGKKETRRGGTRPPHGGPVEFVIRYAKEGSKASRAHYDPEEGVITLNRDHPQLRTAEREAGIESNTYKMLCFDIAFTEYALAVADHLSKQAAAYRKPLDTNALVQRILDRLGRKAAETLERTAPPAEEEG